MYGAYPGGSRPRNDRGGGGGAIERVGGTIECGNTGCVGSYQTSYADCLRRQQLAALTERGSKCVREVGAGRREGGVGEGKG